jgi:hypothetical protein
MPTESPTHIDDLDPTKPAGSEDANLSDNYLRELKGVLKTDFPGITGPVTATQAELNYTDVAVLGTVENSKAVTASATGVTKNMKIDEATSVVCDATDPTKAIGFEVSGATTGKKLTILSSHTDNRTLTMPNATDTLVGKATTDTLTNKTMTSAVLNTGVSGTAVDTDGTLAANSDTKLASQKAVKTYVDGDVKKYGGIYTTYAAGTYLTPAAHSLGGMPDFAVAVAECLTAEHGYSIGDVILLETKHHNASFGAYSYGLQLFWTATTIGGVFGAQVGASAAHKTTGAYVALTAGSWRIYINAYKFR